jgi:cell division protein FtsL
VTSLAEPTRRSRAGPRDRGVARRRASTAGGVVWIAVLGVLLAGIVAVNVAVLRLTVRLDRTSQERVQLQDDVARLQSQLSSAGASSRILRDARDKLGLVPADPTTTTYVRLAP